MGPPGTEQAGSSSQPTVAHPPFDWRCWPDAERLVLDAIDGVLSRLPDAAEFVARLAAATSTRPIDWADHLVLPDSPDARARIESAGFEPEPVPAPPGWTPHRHPGAQLPRLLLAPRRRELALRCESVADVLLANGLSRPISGPLLGPLRQATLFEADACGLAVVERTGLCGYAEPPPGDADPAARLAARELWATRPRRFDDESVAMDRTLGLASRMVEQVGADAAAAIAFAVERDYWQRRNRAAQVQKARQDALGFGWANHDHHTFRSSRRHFRTLIAVFETFGFACRERFCAGAQAGWGAQVMEQPACGLVVFADVDLSADELAIDFARQPLDERDELGTVGLWCALHGESILQAGMHHLEAQFDFDALRSDLAALGVAMMDPFSDLEHLRQAFTVAQRWPVEPDRVRRLRAAGRISPEQANRFLRDGASGSHLENLQRRGGFKGFNQRNVSTIIRATDPRLAGTG